jgi:phosphatidylserine/phosphatidylglycerophosphate/cardiolipin synthase-like enzyme
LGDTSQPGWTGPAVQPYLFDSYVPPAGQVLYRKLDQATGRPLPDTDTAEDWAQDPNDPVNGRRVLYAGWSLDEFFQPAKGAEPATTQFVLAPDNLFDATAALIDSARTSIDIEIYTFSSPKLLEHITARQKAGVQVRVLFDGGVFNSPDGSYDEDRWVAQQIVRNGGQAWFWTDDPADRIPARYNNKHQKFLIVDGARAMITSENFEQTSMPADRKDNGTSGNRGAAVITDAAGVVRRLRDVFAADADPSRKDIQPVNMQATYKAPSDRGDLSGYTVLKPAPLTVTGPLTYEVIQSPESSLRTEDSLIGMVARAGRGDTVLVEQQYEYQTWSGGQLNPRLQAYIAAARRGATVAILTDAVNDGGENERTRDFLADLARSEGLQIEERLGSPAGGPIHNKMVLVASGANAWVHISSINGSENASLFNREMGIQVQSLEAYRYFAQVFAADWRTSGGQLPIDTR